MFQPLVFVVFLLFLTIVNVSGVCSDLPFIYSPGLSDQKPLLNVLSSLDGWKTRECLGRCVLVPGCASFFTEETSDRCIITGCLFQNLSFVEEPGWVGYEIPNTTGRCLPYRKMWISDVADFSSQYASTNNATEIIGAPKVYPLHGDVPGAWAARNWSKGPEWVRVLIAQAMYIVSLNVYETFNPGGIQNVTALQPDGTWDTFWVNPLMTKELDSRIFTIDANLDYPTRDFIIIINGWTAQGWVELDAVEVFGILGE